MILSTVAFKKDSLIDGSVLGRQLNLSQSCTCEAKTACSLAKAQRDHRSRDNGKFGNSPDNAKERRRGNNRCSEYRRAAVACRLNCRSTGTRCCLPVLSQHAKKISRVGNWNSAATAEACTIFGFLSFLNSALLRES